ncbi:MAG: SDR family oxidoreductase [Bryobacteraceae bacterium]
MNASLQGKTTLITGGTRGIGRAVAVALAGAGANVAITGTTESGLRQAVAELSAEFPNKVAGKVADVRDSDSVADLFRWLDEIRWADGAAPGLDILVNNAGVGRFKTLVDLTPEEWRTVIDTNLTGVYFCSRESLFRFRNRGGGYIINMSSLAGKNAFAGGAVYNASKFGLNGMSEAMMLDHRNEDVRVSYIMPGSVATEFSAGGSAAGWKIQPEDVAEIVLMLVKMPARTLVSRVEVRPSRPAQK